MDEARDQPLTPMLQIEMIKVEGGTFWMGDDDNKFDGDKPAHQVKLDTFYIGKYSITQEQWKSVMGENPSEFPDYDKCPVEWVSWDDVQVFLRKLNERYPGKNYRLPTEAEWEYAARGGQLSKGYQYAGSNELDEVGWDFVNSDYQTHPVGQKQPNELGIYDMSGNVWEWCQDKYSETYYQASHNQGIVENPRGPNDGELRVVRGGSWNGNTPPSDCRVSGRSRSLPGNRGSNVGFRCARDL